MTDEMIVDMFWQRSEKAIEETDKLYGRYFHYIANGILRSDEDSKEIVNDTYHKAWNSIPPARPVSLKAFLGRMTRQLSLNRLEKNRAQKRGGGEFALVLDELSEVITDESEEDALAIEELSKHINSFLRSLPLESRRVFIRRYWHMASVSEISKDFSISESKVKSMLFRTREKLRQYLIKEGIKL
jgi:RNA polymerase sigma-70 factor (ECF subfamily)